MRPPRRHSTALRLTAELPTTGTRLGNTLEHVVRLPHFDYWVHTPEADEVCIQSDHWHGACEFSATDVTATAPSEADPETTPATSYSD